jgi:hypothetical protein
LKWLKALRVSESTVEMVEMHYLAGKGKAGIADRSGRNKPDRGLSEPRQPLF